MFASHFRINIVHILCGTSSLYAYTPTMVWFFFFLLFRFVSINFNIVLWMSVGLKASAITLSSHALSDNMPAYLPACTRCIINWFVVDLNKDSMFTIETNMPIEIHWPFPNQKLCSCVNGIIFWYQHTQFTLSKPWSKWHCDSYSFILSWWLSTAGQFHCNGQPCMRACVCMV